MSRRFLNFTAAILLIFAVTLWWFLVPSNAESDKSEIQIADWLGIGPMEARLPIFHDTKNLNGKQFDMKSLLAFEHLSVDKLWPSEGEVFQWDESHSFRWIHLSANTMGWIEFSTPNNDLPQMFYIASYIEAKRWMKIKLSVYSHHLFQVFVDGQKMTEKTSSEQPKDDSTDVAAGKITQEIKLETGKHLLAIKLLKDPVNHSPFRLKATLQLDEPWLTSDLIASISPQQQKSIRHLLDGPKLVSVSVSPDGELTAIKMRQSLPPSDDSESWIELRRTNDGKLVNTYRGGIQVSDVNWSPIGRKFSYTSSGKEGATLWIVDLDQGTATAIMERVKDLGQHTWAPNGTFIIYSIIEKSETDKSGLKKLEGMPDRQPGWRNRTFLYRLNVPQGTRQRLTSGLLSTELNSISPDSKKLLFSRSYEDFTERPYSKQEVFILDLADMTVDTLWTSPWSGTVQWSPDGTKLLVTGGPSMFGGLGINVSEGKIPNDYDTQAYIYDLKSRRAEPITRDFNPTIGQAVWSKLENCIYFTTTDRSLRQLYRYDLSKKRFERIDTGVEVLSNFDLALNRPMAVYSGSSSSRPTKAFSIDLKTRKFRLLADPEAESFRHVVFGRVENWTFKNSRNVEIDGHVYYPPDFDPSKKYPCIVYYYGGTSPVTRDFGGRYPKNLYAANGYIVYVLQPSGAVGYGQEFSALHVNDWGMIVADEIIDGVKKFLAAHPFVDEHRVGCLGASYGGFMTMLLLTKTDIFAAAVAHAGISSISSYWGEGYWGYIYSAVATANSFPWNRKDIYIGQSPLFHADKIKTPLLLLHGSDDTNVPPGESRQLYTALKLLGREVELIEVEGQDHHILNYNKRIKWTKTILAWFDKWLKGQPQWWDELYPKLGK
ncbi:MAG: S9 family peptidase [candidate division KSB1 bacterium]|nr:S9 family peptidase [candidate division KSB1 bacterium]MDZ7334879.1 S9 family peptidase [candidate division KSB1 bacterium]MDZ7357343.1 S9 family peptidase [candidate division KSB1 bacterium]MDZ7375860.1 S9 family peptidase [candidate division KSB1 bacterium]